MAIAKNRLEVGDDGDLSFYEDTGATPKFFWDASAEALGLGTTAPSASYSSDAVKGIRSSGAAPNFTVQDTDTGNQTWLMASYGGVFSRRDTTVSGSSYPFRIDAATAGTFVSATDYMRITATGGSKSLLMGNQDSAGVNKPAMIVGVNGRLRFGHGSSWSTNGGTFTEHMNLSGGHLDITSGALKFGATTAIDSSRNATLGTISSGDITSSGGIESTSLQTSNIYLSTALYTLNTAGNGWDSTINRNSGSPTANLPGGITSGNITTTGYLRGPSTFTIDPAAHGDDTGTVVIAGNLQIDGTTTTINSTTLTVDDKNITLASGSANAAAANGAGITVDGASATLTYVSTGDKWSLNKPLDVLFAGDDGVKIESSDNHSSLFIDSHTAYGQYIRFTENNANKYWINSASGKLVFRPAGTSTVTSQVVFDASGNLGIGTSAPTNHINTGTFFKPDSNGKFLTVNGGANGSFLMLESSTTTDNDQIGGIYFTRTQGQADAHRHVAGIDVIQAAYAPNNTLEGGTLRFFTKGSGSGTNTSRMVINPDGNVGIGTTTPTHTLHAETSATGVYIQREVSSNAANLSEFNSNRSLIIKNRTGGSFLMFGGNGSRTDIQATDGAGTPTAKSIALNPFGGNVGIGTETPGAKLEIKDGDLWLNGATSSSNPEIRFIDDSPTVAGAKIRYGNSDGNLYLEHMWDTATSGFFFRNRTTGTTLNTMALVNGKVGIGTSSPGDKLTIEGSGAQVLSIYSTDTGSQSTAKTFINLYGENTNGDKRLQGQIASAPGHNASNAGELHFSTNNSSSALARRMTIREDGNVGIGDDSPDFKLAIRTPAIPSGSTYAWPLDLSRSNTDGRGLSFGVGTSGGPHAIGAHNGDIGIGQTYGTDSNGLPQFYETLSIVHDGTASIGKVGIGTTSPQENLEIHDATMSTISLSYEGASDNGSSIDFNLRPSSAIASPLTSQIKATDDGAYRQNISFSTKTSAAASSGQTTRMMIKADGNVGIGDNYSYS